MPERSEIVAVALALVLTGSVAAVAFVLARRRSRMWFPPQRRRAVSWDGWVCLLAFLLFALTPELIVKGLVSAGVAPPDADAASRVYRACVAKMVALPLQLAAFALGLKSLGVPFYQLSFGRLRQALTVGIPVWVGVAAATYLVNFAAFVAYRLATGRSPDEHPILQALQSHGTGVFAMLLLAESCFAAPLREELLFRGLIQPWLSTLHAGWAIGIALATFAALAFGGASGTIPGMAFAASLVPLAIALDRWAAVNLKWLIPLHDAVARRRAVGAIVGSAALFANFHAAVWPSPVALFVFGLGIGWVAYRTQSLGPPLVVHSLFNAVATLSILLR